MSASSHFRVIDHTAEGSYIREWPRSLVNSDAQVPKLAVKQYIPLNNQQPQEGDVTIVAAHATGLPKEIYEPLWEEIVKRLEEQHQFRIRSIWIADLFNHGQSGLLNASILGNDPCATDHARDLLMLINARREGMPQPIVGIGHSVGAWQIAHLSLMHPSLFKSLVFMEPGFEPPNPGFAIAAPTLKRKDRWPSRDAAMAEFKNSKFFRKWDPRCLELFHKHALMDVDAAPWPLVETRQEQSQATTSSDSSDASSDDGKEVTLVTSKHQEVAVCIRPIDSDEITSDALPEDSFNRPENVQIFERIPDLKPPFLYLFGTKSGFWSQRKSETVAKTGTSQFGSGGAAKGKGWGIDVEGATHMMPIEKVDECAAPIAEFLKAEHERWTEQEERIQKEWRQRERVDQLIADRRIVATFKDGTPKSSDDDGNEGRITSKL